MKCRREREAIERFYEAHAALIRGGMGVENAVRRLCEQDESLAGVYELQKLGDTPMDTQLLDMGGYPEIASAGVCSSTIG